MTKTNRRSFLTALAVSGGSVTAGCTSLLDDEDPEADSPDEYTPDDTEPTTEAIDEVNPLGEEARNRSIEARTAAFVDPEIGFPEVRSHVTAYSFNDLDVTLKPDGSFVETLDQNSEYTVLAFARRFPDGRIVGSGHSTSFEPGTVSTPEHLSVDMEYRENIVDEEVAVTTHFARDRSVDDDVFGSNFFGPAELFAGTDAFTVTEQGIQRYETAHDRQSDTIAYEELTTQENHPAQGQYTVHNAEGGYFVYFETETPPRSPPILFQIPFYVPKQTFARWKAIDRPRGELPDERTKYVIDSRETGIGPFVGEMLDLSAQFQGYHSDREKLEFISTFVQSLPYALDRISTGYSDYSRLPAETLVDAKGDCVDTTILLCVALLESSVDCEVAYFSYLPEATGSPDAGHLAVGVAPAKFEIENAPYVQTRGQRYYYIEPTAFWEPGRVPPQIDFSQTDVHHV